MKLEARINDYGKEKLESSEVNGEDERPPEDRHIGKTDRQTPALG